MQELRTEDLAMVTYLRSEGHYHNRMELDGDHAVWIFCLDGDKHLHECVADYKDGMAEVEPREYNRVLKRVRGELFKFLRANGVKPPRPRQH